MSRPPASLARARPEESVSAKPSSPQRGARREQRADADGDPRRRRSPAPPGGRAGLTLRAGTLASNLAAGRRGHDGEMAEGDTILRLARRLEAALGGEALAVSAPNPRGRAAGVERLDGRRLDRAEARGKHLLLHFGDLVLHSHLAMSGGWHLYPRGASWRRPRSQAWAVLAGERAGSGRVRRPDPAAAVAPRACAGIRSWPASAPTSSPRTSSPGRLSRRCARPRARPRRRPARPEPGRRASATSSRARPASPPGSIPGARWAISPTRSSPRSCWRAREPDARFRRQAAATPRPSTAGAAAVRAAAAGSPRAARATPIAPPTGARGASREVGATGTPRGARPGRSSGRPPTTPSRESRSTGRWSACVRCRSSPTGPLAGQGAPAQGPPCEQTPQPPRLRGSERVPPLGHRLPWDPPRRRPRDAAPRADPPARRPRRRSPRLARPDLQAHPRAGDARGLRRHCGQPPQHVARHLRRGDRAKSRAIPMSCLRPGSSAEFGGELPRRGHIWGPGISGRSGGAGLSCFRWRKKSQRTVGSRPALVRGTPRPAVTIAWRARNGAATA